MCYWDMRTVIITIHVSLFSCEGNFIILKYIILKYITFL